ncbi:hypothetical protein ACQRIT_000486 [Beauveria bassiana]
MAEEFAKFTLLENRRIEKEDWRDGGEHGTSCLRPVRISRNTGHISLLYFIIAVLSGTLFLRKVELGQKLYSPATNAIQYVTELWPENLAHKTSYMASGADGMPTDKTDQLWNELYEFGISRLSSFEASKLPNETAALPYTSGQYPIQLGVFHQLHCLNNVRMALYPERYSSAFHDLFATDGDGTIFNHTSHDANHLSHCVDSLRLTIMCHSDVTPLTWVYDELKRQPLPTLYVQHTCRKFAAIQDWAAERAIVDEMELNWPTGSKEEFQFEGRPA